MIEFLWIILIFRPIIDLFWGVNILGINLAALVGIIISILSPIYFIKYYKRNKKIDKYIFMYLIWTGTSSLIFNISIDTIINFLRIYSSFIILLILSRNINLEKFEKFMKAYIAVSIVPITIAYLQYIGVVGFTYIDYLSSGIIGRASGGYRTPMDLTRILFFVILYCFYFEKKEKKNIYYRIYIILSIGAVIITYHRMSYIILILELGIWFIFTVKITWRNIVIINLVLVVLVSIGSYKIIKYDSYSNSKISQLFNKNLFETSDGSYFPSIRGRGAVWTGIIDDFKEANIGRKIIGNGTINFYYDNGYFYRNINEAHNDFFRHLHEYGILGLILYINLLFMLIKQVKKNFKYSIDEISVMSLIAFIILILFSFTLDSFMYPNLLYNVFIVMGYSIREENMFYVKEV